LELVAGREELMSSYAVSAVELEFDPGHFPAPEAFITTLKAQPWVTSLVTDQHKLRVAVNNIEEGKHALLSLAAEHHLILNRYEWVRPTLEEIFLKVSA
jgi:hypothetical protein